MDAKRSNTIKVLMLPWLAHGHTSPFLELAKKLSSRNFHIDICSTPVILRSIKNRISDKYSHSIQLVELHLPSSPELPSHYHTTNGLPPHLMPALKSAYENSSSDFSKIVDSLNPDVVIYDFNQPWAADIASSYHIPAIQFLTGGAALIAFGLQGFENLGEDFPFPEIYLREYEKVKMRDARESSVNDVKDIERFFQAVRKSRNILLIKSCRDIEERYIDHLGSILEKKVVPVGILVQDPIIDDENQELFQWLDKKDKDSVVFVSFGSEYFLTKDEREQVARALEISKVNFIWVVRLPMGENLNAKEALPEGFLERVGERGIVVENWAPQARILMHKNTGGFLSHCGWNSIMESIKYGVPIIALPMLNDQPLNARWVEAVGVGTEALRDNNGRFNGEEIAKVMTKVLKDDCGKIVRNKVKELSKKMKMKGDEEIDGLAEELTALCENFDFTEFIMFIC